MSQTPFEPPRPDVAGVAAGGDDPQALLAQGFAAIRATAGVPGAFPPEVLRAGEEATADFSGRLDLTDVGFVTLDPASSTDLDQAFALSVDGDAIVISYAIADIAAFVPRGSVIETEAWTRATTVYAPDGAVPVYPPVLSSGKASLLPDGPRPAMVLSVAVTREGTPTLRSVEKAIVRSRAKLAYETVTDSELGPVIVDLAARIEAAEERRGAFRVEFPEQLVERDPHASAGVRLALAPTLRSEQLNAALSLATNLAVANTMMQHGLGLYRVMDDPDGREISMLHRSARSLGIEWPDGEGLRRLVPRLDVENPKHACFIALARRAGGGASYALVGPNTRPWHAAMAASYAHATAPMRRLADRYVLDAVWAQLHGEEVDRDVLSRLPDVMEQAEQRAARVDRESLDLVECVMLRARVGEVFSATVIEVDQHGATIEIQEPAVRSRAKVGSAQPGDTVQVRLVGVDLANRRQTWERVT